jgi:hypothetical protein
MWTLPLKGENIKAKTRLDAPPINVNPLMVLGFGQSLLLAQKAPVTEKDILPIVQRCSMPRRDGVWIC